MSKLLSFILLNISFVVVFDGRLKPHKLRNGPAPIGDFDFERDYEGLLEICCSAKPLEYSEGFPLVEALRRELEKAKIDYIQAPAEAEAQCAHLQKHGIVDYVLTNDGDTFVFGATKILRNFSRYVEDVAVSPSKLDKLQVLDEYFVTPVRMERVKAEIGFDTWRLIFLVCLRGGDYSVGAKQVGIVIAKKLALCGTVFAGRGSSLRTKDNQVVKIPDFVELFRNCLTTKIGHQFFAPWAHVADATSRVQSLSEFEEQLHAFVTAHSALIFGRNLAFTNPIKICPDTALFYSNPFVDRRIYKFYPQTLSFAETKLITNDLRLPPFHGSTIAGVNAQVVRTNSVYGADDHKCGKLVIQIKLDEAGDVQVSENEYRGVAELSLPYLSVPLSFSGKIKTIIGRLLSYSRIADKPILDFLIVSRKKEIRGVEYLMIKYEAGLIHEAFPFAELVARESSPTKNGIDEVEIDLGSPSKLLQCSIWIPQIMAKILNPHLIDLFAQRKESPRKRSPKKSPGKPTQKTTLDHFGSFLESPTKKKARRSIIPTASPERSLPKLSFTRLDPLTQTMDPPPQTLDQPYKQVRSQVSRLRPMSRMTQQQLSFPPSKNAPDTNPFLDTSGPRSSQSDDDLLKLLKQVDENVLNFENSRKSIGTSDRAMNNNSVISVNSSDGGEEDRIKLTTDPQLIIVSSQED